MSTKSSVPIEIEKIGLKEISIRWQDGHVSNYLNAYLRESCQCASCVDEWSSEKLISAENIPEDIASTSIKAVGHYAISIHWSDGHQTGIYPFDHLRRICPCPDCQKASD